MIPGSFSTLEFNHTTNEPAHGSDCTDTQMDGLGRHRLLIEPQQAFCTPPLEMPASIRPISVHASASVFDRLAVSGPVICRE